jgi:hypothetical protein
MVAPLAGTPAWGHVEQLTAWFEHTPQLDQVVASCQATRCVALIGPAGQGKSTLVAALARWDLADDLLPPRFLHALVFATPTAQEADLAGDLAAQLTITVDNFAAAASAFEAQNAEEDLTQLGPFARQIIGPLSLLDDRRPVRLAIDGLDQLAVQAAPPVNAALTALANNPGLGHVRLIMAARPDALLPPGTGALQLGAVDREYVERYLQRRRVPAPTIPVIADRAAGNWLIARLLADLAVEGVLDGGQLPSTLQATYRDELRRAGSDDSTRWTRELRPVLSVLAAAGVGPVLPLRLLCDASGRLSGPDEPARVRDVLVQLRGLVVRGAPGTPQEHVGAFHPTFAEYLQTDPDIGIVARAAHAALADAIDALAPRSAHDPDNPLHRYAELAEAEHLWAAGRLHEAVVAVLARQSHIPAANLARTTAWLSRLDEALGPDHPNFLTIRHEVAHWTGHTGNAAGALRQHQEVLAARERILGPDHPGTLASRHEVAYWTGESGNPQEALRLYREVLPAQERVLGPDHPNTLTTRHEVARWTAQTGDSRGALQLFREVLAAREQALDHADPQTLGAATAAEGIGRS